MTHPLPREVVTEVTARLMSLKRREVHPFASGMLKGVVENPRHCGDTSRAVALATTREAIAEALAAADCAIAGVPNDDPLCKGSVLVPAGLAVNLVVEMRSTRIPACS